MNKNGTWVLWLSVGLVVMLLIGFFFFFASFKPNNESLYLSPTGQAVLENPATNLATEQAVAQFNESFILYLLYTIEAYNLHNPPLSNYVPEMEVIVEDQTYRATIINGHITVEQMVGGGSSQTADISIRTTREETVKMLKNKVYIQQSFSKGGSSIELIADKATLFSKGYLNLYTELTGKSVTGNIIRMYLS